MRFRAPLVEVSQGEGLDSVRSWTLSGFVRALEEFRWIHDSAEALGIWMLQGQDLFPDPLSVTLTEPCEYTVNIVFQDDRRRDGLNGLCNAGEEARLSLQDVDCDGQGARYGSNFFLQDGLEELPSSRGSPGRERRSSFQERTNFVLALRLYKAVLPGLLYG